MKVVVPANLPADEREVVEKVNVYHCWLRAFKLAGYVSCGIMICAMEGRPGIIVFISPNSAE